MKAEKELKRASAATPYSFGLHLDECYQNILRDIQKAFPWVQSAVVYVYNPYMNLLVPQQALHYSEKQSVCKPDENGVGKGFTRREPFVLYEKDTVRICVPLFAGEELIGVLTAGCLEADFSECYPDDLLKFILNYADILQHAYTFSLNVQVQELQTALTKAALEEEGADSLLKVLTDNYYFSCGILNSKLETIACSNWNAEIQLHALVSRYAASLNQVLDERTCSCFPVTSDQVILFPMLSADEPLGMLVFFVPEEEHLSVLEMDVIAKIVPILTVEMKRTADDLPNQYQYSGYILEQILHRSYDKLSLNQLIELNFPDEEQHAYVVAKLIINDPLLTYRTIQEKKKRLQKILYRHIASLAYQTLVLEQNFEITFMFIVPSNEEKTAFKQEIQAFFDKITEEAAQYIQLNIQVGLGKTVASLTEAVQSHADAEKCLHFLKMTKQSKQVLTVDELGVYTLFLSAEKEMLLHYVEETAGTLLEYEQKNDTELIKTVKVYLESNQNMAETAKILYVHPNTIKYRLTTIENLLGINKIRGKSAFELQLALYILDYMQISQ